MPPGPRRLAAEDRSSPAGVTDETRGNVLLKKHQAPGVSGNYAWLLSGTGPGESVEAKHFRKQLAQGLLSEERSTTAAASDSSFLQLYRVVRDALEDGVVIPSSSEVRSAVRRRAGAERLAGVVRRQVRAAFRDIDVWTTQAAARAHSGPSAWWYVGQPLGPDGQDEDIVAGLISSQAKAAVILERRAAQVPWAYLIGWLLSRAHSRILYGILERWKQCPPVEVVAGAPRSVPSGSQLLLPGFDDRGRHIAPGPLIGLNAGAGSGPSPRNAPSPSPGSSTRRWGGAARGLSSPSSSTGDVRRGAAPFPQSRG